MTPTPIRTVTSERLLAEVKAERDRATMTAEQRYNDYLDWCEDEKRPPLYKSRAEFEDAI